MTTTTSLSIFAQLAQAAYVYPATGSTLAEQLQNSEQTKFSATQAQSFVDRYDLVDQKANDDYGFSATLFEDKANAGRMILSCRGTEPGVQGVLVGADLVDADVLQLVNSLTGCAVDQIISLYNYILRLSAPPGTDVVQYTSQWGDSYGFVGTRSYIDKGAGIGALLNADGTLMPFDVTGHSLGGHLAMAAGRLFPDRVGSLVTFNGAGFQPAGVADMLFDSLLGRPSSFPPNFVNAYAEDGPELVTNSLFMDQFGIRVPYAIDYSGLPSDTIAWHGMDASADALAVMSVLNGLSVSQASAVLRAASPDCNRVSTLLENLYSVTGLAVPPASGRELVYASVHAFGNYLADKSVISLAEILPDNLALWAEQSASVRAALLCLSPVAVAGAEPPVIAAGERSPEYWHDRAILLTDRLAQNLADSTSSLPSLSDGSGLTILDKENGITAVHSGSGSQWAIFAADSGDTSVDGSYAGAARIYGSDVGNTLKGSVGDDQIWGFSGNDNIDGGAGRDEMHGGAGGDTLGGLAGSAESGVDSAGNYIAGTLGNVYEGGGDNDVLRGTAGADEYRFNFGDGMDSIAEVEAKSQPAGTKDVLKLGEGLAPSDFTVTRENTNLVLSHINGTDKVTILGWYAGTPGGTANQIERAEFADGTVWTAEEMTAWGLATYGTENPDTMVVASAGGWATSAFGLESDDKITGSSGKDYLYGGIGNDTLDGSYGSDYLYGGAGDDTVGGAPNSGDANGSANVYDGGTGNDTLRGTYYGDTYVFRAGDGADSITEVYQGTGSDVIRFEGVSASDVAVTRNGTDLVLSYGTNDKVTVTGWYYANYYQVERVEFGDGTVWTASELTARGLEVHGTDANDTLTGVSNWANRLYGEGGSDALTGSNATDYLYGGDGNDTLDGSYGTDYLYGGAGNDILGGAANGQDYNSSGNVYDGGTGNDTLRATMFNDTYVFRAGDGADTIAETNIAATSATDVIRFEGVSPSDVVVSRNGTNLVLSYGGTDKITVNGWFNSWGGTAYQVERVQFDNGTVWTASQLSTRGLEVHGTEANDTLTGVSSWTNRLYGEGGNDALTGSNYTDYLYGGDGADTLDGSYGTDFLYGGVGNDVLGGAPNSGDANGSANVYDGGTGNDTLRGTCYGDTYVFRPGDGADAISEIQSSNSSADVIRFDGVSPSDVVVSREGVNLVLTYGASDRVSIANWYSETSTSNRQIERVEFGDGSTWDANYLTTRGLEVHGTDNNDTLTGLNGWNNKLYGEGGSDAIYGGTIGDILVGSWGNDLLDAGGGSDTLQGGTENDTVKGGSGDDLYIYSPGDGRDTLIESGGIADVLRFDDILIDNVQLWHQGNDLVVDVGGSSQAVVVQNQFSGGNYLVESFVFDGAMFSAAEIAARTQVPVVPI